MKAKTVYRSSKKGAIFFVLSSLLWLILVSCSGDGGRSDSNGSSSEPVIKRMSQYTTSKAYPSKFSDENFHEWLRLLPQIQEVWITSSIDGKQEPALFYSSGSKKKKPLLVVLHSWSSEYLQEVSIPYAEWAEKYDWAFMQPNFRGKFEKPEATASDLAVQDIVDAVKYAQENENIDPNRIYLVGSSGGAMTALVVASRHPDIWAGVVAWVPILDLVDWYDFNLYYPDRVYNEQVAASCGGIPEPGTPAAEECLRRSPVTYLEQARNVPIFVLHGIKDVLVPASHSLRAFNILAEPEDTLSQEQMEYIDKEQALPQGLEGTTEDPFFAKGDPPVVFSRKSANVKLVLFDGVHDMAYNPTLLWLNEQKRK